MLPETNARVVEAIYCVEVGLRELIVERLSADYGSLWWKTRLPGDVRDAVGKGRQYEKRVKWTQSVSHHPLYYIDFPDLLKVIVRADNWQDVFQPFFARKEVLVGTLTELEPIRNKVSHNRKATEADCRIAEAAYEKIATGIGKERFATLISRCTTASAIVSDVRDLREEACVSLDCCLRYHQLSGLPRWEAASTAWWFDDDYLCLSVAPVAEYFQRLVAYSQLPRHRGTGQVIESWVSSNDMDKMARSALEVLDRLIQNEGEWHGG